MLSERSRKVFWRTRSKETIIGKKNPDERTPYTPKKTKRGLIRSTAAKKLTEGEAIRK